MARPRIYYEWEVPASVVSIVRGVCADYERRENAIKHSSISGAVLERYIELNAAVDYALDALEAGVKKYILDDITLGRGYDFSPCSAFVSKATYYNKKRKLVHDIADKLHLIP